MSTDIQEFQAALPHLDKSNTFQVWARDNCGKTKGGTPTKPWPGTELDKWFSFKNALLASKSVPLPSMISEFGNYLVLSAAMALPDGVAPAPDPNVPQAFFTEDSDDSILDSRLIKWTGTEQITDSPFGTKAILVRTVSNTAGSGAPNSQMGCVYMNAPNAHGAEGMRTAYGINWGVKSDYLAIPGQWNFVKEWHIPDSIPQNVSGSRAASCALGVWSNFTDRATNKAYGPNDFVLVMAVRGGDYSNPYGSDQNFNGTYYVLGPISSFLGRSTRFVFDFLWTQGTGLCDMYVDGTQKVHHVGPTLFRAPDGSSGEVGCGVYNYHPAVARQIDMYFDNWKIGPEAGSVL